MFQKNITQDEVDRIIDILFANKMISETNNTITYDFWDINRVEWKGNSPIVKKHNEKRIANKAVEHRLPEKPGQAGQLREPLNK